MWIEKLGHRRLQIQEGWRSLHTEWLHYNNSAASDFADIWYANDDVSYAYLSALDRHLLTYLLN